MYGCPFWTFGKLSQKVQNLSFDVNSSFFKALHKFTEYVIVVMIS